MTGTDDGPGSRHACSVSVAAATAQPPATSCASGDAAAATARPSASKSATSQSPADAVQPHLTAAGPETSTGLVTTPGAPGRSALWHGAAVAPVELTRVSSAVDARRPRYG